MNRSFEDLEVWKKACRLSVDTFKAFEIKNYHPLKDQICRAAVSIASNIAEGRDRYTRNEFIRFLRIAQGSAAELRTQFYIAKEIELLAKEIMQDFIERTKSISQMLQALVNSLRSTVNSQRSTD